jgi:hypothetical protein
VVDGAFVREEKRHAAGLQVKAAAEELGGSRICAGIPGEANFDPGFRTFLAMASNTVPPQGRAIAYGESAPEISSPTMGEVPSAHADIRRREGEAAFRCETIIARFGVRHSSLPFPSLPSPGSGEGI